MITYLTNWQISSFSRKDHGHLAVNTNNIHIPLCIKHSHTHLSTFEFLLLLSWHLLPFSRCSIRDYNRCFLFLKGKKRNRTEGVRERDTGMDIKHKNLECPPDLTFWFSAKTPCGAKRFVSMVTDPFSGFDITAETNNLQIFNGHF